MKKSMLIAVAAAIAATGFAVQAETMQMHSLADSPANTAAGVPRPDRGLSMNTVRARFGTPPEVIGPVGDPPITRWIYPDYTVFFEHSHVIHSVVHRDLRAASQP